MSGNQQQQNYSNFSQFNLPHSQGAPQNNPILNNANAQPTVVSTQILPSHRAIPFIDQSQYITTTVPVQPFTAAPDYLPAQNQIQDHLQRKHEELQKLIIEQQNELRRVSEQLFMVNRYGIMSIPVNVSVPQIVSIDHTEVTATSRCLSATHSYQERPITQHLENQNQYEANQSSTNVFQTVQQHDDFELIPFQMNHQTQILFSNDKESNNSK